MSAPVFAVTGAAYTFRSNNELAGGAGVEVTVAVVVVGGGGGVVQFARPCSCPPRPYRSSCYGCGVVIVVVTVLTTARPM